MWQQLEELEEKIKQAKAEQNSIKNQG